MFADENGAKVSDSYLDVILVSVYKLARTMKPAELPGMKKELNATVEQMMGSLASGKVVEPLSSVTIDGVPGFALDYTCVTGAYLYQIIAQATTGNWDALKGKLEAAAGSFTVK